ncbi:hypothetical protein HMPREF1531_00380 [Propionibacterium sp. oral taxon 192 str. F0372]|uniref:acyl-CoA carboxylase subunit beta n=1 Tax=Propionibacterium sp. oral taxon 192 TaxID=671222 RepID=UPI00035342AC|nr:acyl-CoA carboxylase subunit beta [Propionibacterium sp. oral taxon 192]EPH06778.1 hypothetical protein HMPREF1531_00380 [Propionibacterium sp. oral taxon 192 str. F0372]
MATQHTMAERIEHLSKERARVQAGGGEARIAKQHEKGKMSARERIELFVDPGSFTETGAFRKNRTTAFGMDKADMPADGVVTGHASLMGRPVFLASQDFSVVGGSAGETHNIKVTETMESALTAGAPFIFINDSGGARVQEGIDSLSGYGKVFFANVKLSGVVPQISIIAGPCAGGAVYSPALTDFIIQTRKAHMFITGPNVIKQVTGEEVTQDQLGGADAHQQISGVIDFVADDDEQALLIAQKVLSFLPSNSYEEAPIHKPDYSADPDESFRDIVPIEGNKGYDVRDVISKIVDYGDFLEVKAGYAANIVTGFGRVGGRSVGFIANQPKVMSGVLDINASDKGGRFIRICDAYNIPIINLVDVPGFLPGVAQEHGGIIRHGAKMLFAYSAATVPKITVVLRKAYGGSYLAMCSKELGADKVFAWPSAEIAVMGADGAAAVVFRKEIENAEDPAAKRAELVEAYREKFATPFASAAHGYVDDVIDPAATRREILVSLELLANKRIQRPAKKHGIFPV